MRKKILIIIFMLLMSCLFVVGCNEQKEETDKGYEELQIMMNYIMPDGEGDNVSLYQVGNFVYIVHSKDKLIEHNGIVGKEFRLVLDNDGRITEIQNPDNR